MLVERAEHDYPSPASFLNLVARSARVEVLTALLSQVPTMHHAAKDVLRAAGLPLLPHDDPEVAKDLTRLADEVALSPGLLGQRQGVLFVPVDMDFNSTIMLVHSGSVIVATRWTYWTID
jgi:hypothetical protein